MLTLNDSDRPKWSNKTGVMTVWASSMQGIYDQVYEDEGLQVRHVNPKYLVVVLVRASSGSMEQLSNTVRISVK